MPIFSEHDVTVEMGWCREEECRHRTFPEAIASKDVIGGQIMVYKARCPVCEDELGPATREVSWPDHMLWRRQTDLAYSIVGPGE